jgi:hypothetical protein
MPDFTFRSNEAITFAADAVQSDGTTPASVTAEGATVDDPTLLDVHMNPGFPDQVVCIGKRKPGLATITVSGVNKDGNTITKPVTAQINPAPPSPDAAATFVTALVAGPTPIS